MEPGFDRCAGCDTLTDLTEMWRGSLFCSVSCLREYQAGVAEHEHDFMQSELLLREVEVEEKG